MNVGVAVGLRDVMSVCVQPRLHVCRHAFMLLPDCLSDDLVTDRPLGRPADRLTGRPDADRLALMYVCVWYVREQICMATRLSVFTRGTDCVCRYVRAYDSVYVCMTRCMAGVMYECMYGCICA